MRSEKHHPHRREEDAEARSLAARNAGWHDALPFPMRRTVAIVAVVPGLIVFSWRWTLPKWRPLQNPSCISHASPPVSAVHASRAVCANTAISPFCLPAKIGGYRHPGKSSNRSVAILEERLQVHSHFSLASGYLVLPHLALSRRTGTLTLCWTGLAVLPRNRSATARCPCVPIATKSQPFSWMRFTISRTGSP